MITVALLNLNDRKGNSDMAIWNFCKVQFPDCNPRPNSRKVFMAHLKRMSDEGVHVEKTGINIRRYRLTSKFRNTFIKHMSKGEKVTLARLNTMTKATK